MATCGIKTLADNYELGRAENLRRAYNALPINVAPSIITTQEVTLVDHNLSPIAKVNGKLLIPN